MKFNNDLMKKAKSQTMANLVCLSGEGEGSKWFSAIVKAATELRENNSLSFDRENETLTFVSRFSGKTRIVTKFGCHRVSCECGNGISYHRSLFEIIKRYYELEDAAKPRFAEQNSAPYLKASGERKRERIGGVFV